MIFDPNNNNQFTQLLAKLGKLVVVVSDEEDDGWGVAIRGLSDVRQVL